MQNYLRPPFFRFHNVEEYRNTFVAAGFGQVTRADVSTVRHFSASAALFDGISPSTVRTAALLRARVAKSLAALRMTTAVSTLEWCSIRARCKPSAA